MTDPRTRLIALTLTGLLAITLESPLALGLLTLLSAVALVRAGLDPRWWRRALGLAVVIVWSTVLSQGLFYAEQPRVAWVELGPLTLWREGVIWGLVQSLRLLSVSMAGLALAISTSPDRIFAGLIQLRMPYGLAFMAVTALRFVPQVAREVQTVHRARARRGAHRHHGEQNARVIRLPPSLGGRHLGRQSKLIFYHSKLQALDLRVSPFVYYYF